ncbi:class III signal peptide-containing protein [Candidatus Micrarchaeota archaeon]|nr:class III signal peptide-containing protein [Candidatus Micrarchaeota archaeon]
MCKGQGTFEYVILLAGVLLIAVLAMVVLSGSFQQSASSLETAKTAQCRTEALQSSLCFAEGEFDPEASFSSAMVPEDTRCDCANFIGDRFSGIQEEPVSGDAVGGESKLSFVETEKEVVYSISFKPKERADVEIVYELPFDCKDFESGRVVLKPPPTSIKCGSLIVAWDFKGKRFDAVVKLKKAQSKKRVSRAVAPKAFKLLEIREKKEATSSRPSAKRQ